MPSLVQDRHGSLLFVTSLLGVGCFIFCFSQARIRQRKMREQVAAYRLEREREDARRVEVERMLAKEKRVHSQVNGARMMDRAEVANPVTIGGRKRHVNCRVPKVRADSRGSRH